jgi:integrase
MAKGMALRVKKVPGRALPWLVNLPPIISDTGKRQRRFFETKLEAEAFASDRKNTKEQRVYTARYMTPAELEQATAARDLAAEYGATLLEAVGFFVAAKKREQNTVTLDTLYELFETLKAKKSRRYKEAQRATRAKIESIKEKLLCDITPAHIETTLKGSPATTRNSHLRNLRAVFNLAVKKEWLVKSPISKVDWSDAGKGEPSVLSPEQAKKLLETCAGDCADLLAYFALGLFCGIRPAELERLEWRDVHYLDGEHYVELRPEVTKSKRRRTIDLSENAVEWLRTIQAMPISGRLIDSDDLRDRLRQVRVAAGWESGTWPQDSMRHTFASMWLAEHNDINKLTLMMGHTGTTVLFEHYHRSTRKTEAEKFWAIVPKVE